MVEFYAFHPVLQALIATTFTWAMTALGAAFIFIFGCLKRKHLDALLGFSAGVMMAMAALLLFSPAFKMTWISATVGFLAGGLFMAFLDKILPHLHQGSKNTEGLHTSWHRTVLLVLAITFHNLPEGLAVGVAFGAAAAGLASYTIGIAIALTIGMGIHNLPEGLAVSLPLRCKGLSRAKSFWYGQLPAVVEPVGGIVGAAIVLISLAVIPYALAFAAGAMIFIVVEELIPESQHYGNSDIATIGLLIGFIFMVALEILVG